MYKVELQVELPAYHLPRWQTLLNILFLFSLYLNHKLIFSYIYDNAIIFLSCDLMLKHLNLYLLILVQINNVQCSSQESRQKLSALYPYLTLLKEQRKINLNNYLVISDWCMWCCFEICKHPYSGLLTFIDNQSVAWASLI
jgi:hypothetical protein